MAPVQQLGIRLLQPGGAIDHHAAVAGQANAEHADGDAAGHMLDQLSVLSKQPQTGVSSGHPHRAGGDRAQQLAAVRRQRGLVQIEVAADRGQPLAAERIALPDRLDLAAIPAQQPRRLDMAVGQAQRIGMVECDAGDRQQDEQQQPGDAGEAMQFAKHHLSRPPVGAGSAPAG